LVVERDVTEEKQKERIKTEFISVVSHELRTPMTVIRGYSTLLAEGKLGELNEKQKEYINKINTETGQLLELANDMLDIQKFESGKIDLKYEKTDMAEFVKKFVDDSMEEFQKKGLTLGMENNLKKNFANIDVKYFSRVVTNLLSNAYKYTEKGEVKVFLVNPDEEHIVIAVKDTGIGIKEESLGHLFERFYQADGVLQRKQEGSGLGLSIIKRVAEAHSGMVWVESKLGVGSTFYVAIPAVV
jgi:signal transduction histidine kinase